MTAAVSAAAAKGPAITALPSGENVSPSGVPNDHAAGMGTGRGRVPRGISDTFTEDDRSSLLRGSSGKMNYMADSSGAYSSQTFEKNGTGGFFCGGIGGSFRKDRSLTSGKTYMDSMHSTPSPALPSPHSYSYGGSSGNGLGLTLPPGAVITAGGGGGTGTYYPTSPSMTNALTGQSGSPSAGYPSPLCSPYMGGMAKIVMTNRDEYSDFEDGLLQEINLLRSNPKQYAAIFEREATVGYPYICSDDLFFESDEQVNDQVSRWAMMFPSANTSFTHGGQVGGGGGGGHGNAGGSFPIISPYSPNCKSGRGGSSGSTSGTLHPASSPSAAASSPSSTTPHHSSGSPSASHAGGTGTSQGSGAHSSNESTSGGATPTKPGKKSGKLARGGGTRSSFTAANGGGNGDRSPSSMGGGGGGHHHYGGALARVASFRFPKHHNGNSSYSSTDRLFGDGDGGRGGVVSTPRAPQTPPVGTVHSCGMHELNVAQLRTFFLRHQRHRTLLEKAVKDCIHHWQLADQALSDSWAVEDSQITKKGKRTGGGGAAGGGGAGGASGGTGVGGGGGAGGGGQGRKRSFPHSSAAADELWRQRSHRADQLHQIYLEKLQFLMRHLCASRDTCKRAMSGTNLILDCLSALKEATSVPPLRASRGLKLAARDTSQFFHREKEVMEKVFELHESVTRKICPSRVYALKMPPPPLLAPSPNSTTGATTTTGNKGVILVPSHRQLGGLGVSPTVSFDARSAAEAVFYLESYFSAPSQDTRDGSSNRSGSTHILTLGPSLFGVGDGSGGGAGGGGGPLWKGGRSPGGGSLIADGPLIGGPGGTSAGDELEKILSSFHANVVTTRGPGNTGGTTGENGEDDDDDRRGGGGKKEGSGSNMARRRSGSTSSAGGETGISLWSSRDKNASQTAPLPRLGSYRKGGAPHGSSNAMGHNAMGFSSSSSAFPLIATYSHNSPLRSMVQEPSLASSTVSAGRASPPLIYPLPETNAYAAFTSPPFPQLSDQLTEELHAYTDALAEVTHDHCMDYGYVSGEVRGVQVYGKSTPRGLIIKAILGVMEPVFGFRALHQSQPSANSLLSHHYPFRPSTSSMRASTSSALTLPYVSQSLGHGSGGAPSPLRGASDAWRREGSGDLSGEPRRGVPPPLPLSNENRLSLSQGGQGEGSSAGGRGPGGAVSQQAGTDSSAEAVGYGPSQACFPPPSEEPQRENRGWPIGGPTRLVQGSGPLRRASQSQMQRDAGVLHPFENSLFYRPFPLTFSPTQRSHSIGGNAGASSPTNASHLTPLPRRAGERREDGEDEGEEEKETRGGPTPPFSFALLRPHRSSGSFSTASSPAGEVPKTTIGVMVDGCFHPTTPEAADFFYAEEKAMSTSAGKRAALATQRLGPLLWKDAHLLGCSWQRAVPEKRVPTYEEAVHATTEEDEARAGEGGPRSPQAEEGSGRSSRAPPVEEVVVCTTLVVASGFEELEMVEQYKQLRLDAVRRIVHYHRQGGSGREEAEVEEVEDDGAGEEEDGRLRGGVAGGPCFSPLLRHPRGFFPSFSASSVLSPTKKRGDDSKGESVTGYAFSAEYGGGGGRGMRSGPLSTLPRPLSGLSRSHRRSPGMAQWGGSGNAVANRPAVVDLHSALGVSLLYPTKHPIVLHPTERTAWLALRADTSRVSIVATLTSAQAPPPTVPTVNTSEVLVMPSRDHPHVVLVLLNVEAAKLKIQQTANMYHHYGMVSSGMSSNATSVPNTSHGDRAQTSGSGGTSRSGYYGESTNGSFGVGGGSPGVEVDGRVLIHLFECEISGSDWEKAGSSPVRMTPCENSLLGVHGGGLNAANAADGGSNPSSSSSPNTLRASVGGRGNLLSSAGGGEGIGQGSGEYSMPSPPMYASSSPFSGTPSFHRFSSASTELGVGSASGEGMESHGWGRAREVSGFSPIGFVRLTLPMTPLLVGGEEEGEEGGGAGGERLRLHRARPPHLRPHASGSTSTSSPSLPLRRGETHSPVTAMAIRERGSAFEGKTPPLSGTESMGGHPLGHSITSANPSSSPPTRRERTVGRSTEQEPSERAQGGGVADYLSRDPSSAYQSPGSTMRPRPLITGVPSASEREAEEKGAVVPVGGGGGWSESLQHRMDGERGEGLGTSTLWQTAMPGYGEAGSGSGVGRRRRNTGRRGVAARNAGGIDRDGATGVCPHYALLTTVPLPYWSLLANLHLSPHVTNEVPSSSSTTAVSSARGMMGNAVGIMGGGTAGAGGSPSTRTSPFSSLAGTMVEHSSNHPLHPLSPGGSPSSFITPPTTPPLPLSSTPASAALYAGGHASTLGTSGGGGGGGRSEAWTATPCGGSSVVWGTRTLSTPSPPPLVPRGTGLGPGFAIGEGGERETSCVGGIPYGTGMELSNECFSGQTSPALGRQLGSGVRERSELLWYGSCGWPLCGTEFFHRNATLLRPLSGVLTNRDETSRFSIFIPRREAYMRTPIAAITSQFEALLREMVEEGAEEDAEEEEEEDTREGDAEEMEAADVFPEAGNKSKKGLQKTGKDGTNASGPVEKKAGSKSSGGSSSSTKKAASTTQQGKKGGAGAKGGIRSRRGSRKEDQLGTSSEVDEDSAGGEREVEDAPAAKRGGGGGGRGRQEGGKQGANQKGSTAEREGKKNGKGEKSSEGNRSTSSGTEGKRSQSQKKKSNLRSDSVNSEKHNTSFSFSTGKAAGGQKSGGEKGVKKKAATTRQQKPSSSGGARSRSGSAVTRSRSTSNSSSDSHATVETTASHKHKTAKGGGGAGSLASKKGAGGASHANGRSGSVTSVRGSTSGAGGPGSARGRTRSGIALFSPTDEAAVSALLQLPPSQALASFDITVRQPLARLRRLLRTIQSDAKLYRNRYKAAEAAIGLRVTELEAELERKGGKAKGEGGSNRIKQQRDVLLARLDTMLHGVLEIEAVAQRLRGEITHRNHKDVVRRSRIAQLQGELAKIQRQASRHQPLDVRLWFCAHCDPTSFPERPSAGQYEPLLALSPSPSPFPVSYPPPVGISNTSSHSGSSINTEGMDGLPSCALSTTKPGFSAPSASIVPSPLRDHHVALLPSTSPDGTLYETDVVIPEGFVGSITLLINDCEAILWRVVDRH